MTNYSVILKKAGTFFLLITSFSLFFTDCKTLPAPKTNSDTLLVIPIGYEKNSTKAWFGHYKINITDSSDGKVVKTKLLPIRQNGFIAISGLKPGHYYISKDIFVYDSKNNRDSGSGQNRYIGFDLFPKRITVLSNKFIYMIFDGTNNTYAMNRKWVLFTTSQKEKLLQGINDYKNYSLWGTLNK